MNVESSKLKTEQLKYKHEQVCIHIYIDINMLRCLLCAVLITYYCGKVLGNGFCKERSADFSGGNLSAVVHRGVLLTKWKMC